MEEENSQIKKQTDEDPAVADSIPDEGTSDGSLVEETDSVPEEAESPVPEEALVACKKEIKKNWDLYLHAHADLDNYRKRAKREKEELARFGNENIIRELLPVLDNLERAVEHARSESSDSEGLLQGVEMTISQFQKALEKFGAIPFSALGEPFDPAKHEAMGQVETEEHPPNTVVQELQKGCLLNERLLRPAMVMISKVPAKKPSSDIENG